MQSVESSEQLNANPVLFQPHPVENSIEQAVDNMATTSDPHLTELSASLPCLDKVDPASAEVVVTNVPDTEPALIVEAPAQEETGPILVPFNTTAKKRISNMLVQIVSAMRHEVAKGSTLDDAYAMRLKAIDDNTDLDEASKSSARIIIKQAYETAKTLPPVDKDNKQEMGALAVLASGLINMSDAMRHAKVSNKQRKRAKSPHSKKTMEQRKKNKVAKVSRRKNRK